MPALLIFFMIPVAVTVLYIVWRIVWGYTPDSLPGVLAYHKVTRFEFGGNWMTPSRFASQLDALIDGGYRFIGEEAFLETIYGSRTGSPKEVLLTFDDGYQELIEYAVPQLERRSIPALIFIVSSFAGLENRWELDWPGRRFTHMSWDEAADLAGRGFSFGSHTRTHRDLSRLTLEEVREELVLSRSEIEIKLGLTVESLSYPFGRLNRVIAEEASLAGYRAAFSLYPPRGYRSGERFALRREGVYIIDTAFCIKNKLGRDGFFWIEDIKGRAINGVSVLTPLLKGDRY